MINSFQSGILMSSIDVGSICFVVFGSHFGKFYHIPRLLSVSAVVAGVAVMCISAVQEFNPRSLPSSQGVNSRSNDIINGSIAGLITPANFSDSLNDSLTLLNTTFDATPPPDSLVADLITSTASPNQTDLGMQEPSNQPRDSISGNGTLANQTQNMPSPKKKRSKRSSDGIFSSHDFYQREIDVDFQNSPTTRIKYLCWDWDLYAAFSGIGVGKKVEKGSDEYMKVSVLNVHSK